MVCLMVRLWLIVSWFSRDRGVLYALDPGLVCKDWVIILSGAFFFSCLAVRL